VAKDQLIDIDSVVHLLGVPKTSLEVFKSSLPDFPDGIGKKGCTKFYSRNAVLKWRKSHDVRTLIRDLSRARYRSRRVPPAAEPGNRQLDFDLAQRFLRGAFAGPSQREQIEMKKLVARNFGKGITQRVTVASDWHD
jgi:hypothetical protein